MDEIPAKGVSRLQEDPGESALGDEISIESSETVVPALPYPLVVFGASAGGLRAFREVLENLPDKTGMTFVLVTHLAPDQKSYLTEIMERHTAMPVLAIEQDKQPAPDHVYILLPNQYVRIVGGRFQLQERESSDRVPSPIDIFFHSVALDQRNMAIGVVLSGADADGALGLKAIKAEGGFALVQTPHSAQSEAMPRNSIAADHVDMVLPPNELALELARLAYQLTRPSLLPPTLGKTVADEDAMFQAVLHLIRDRSGIDLRGYKPGTIRRRLARRMMLLRMESIADYRRLLLVQTDEVQRLQDDLLISVTGFFRDPGFWEDLVTTTLPSFFENRAAETPVRLWCAGCATGEEAYSLAIALLEYTSQHGIEIPIQIFCTDVNERSIEVARSGSYPEAIAGELTPERLRRFFTKGGRGYQISKRVRDLCLFARQNLCSDPPFSHIDLISCRNVMIYFDKELQQQVLSTFHYALEPGGYLLLGMSESLRDVGQLFCAADRRNKIYTKQTEGTGVPRPLRSYRSVHSPRTRAAIADPVRTWPDQEILRLADRIALARYSPPGMMLDEQMNVLHLRGQTSEFVEPSPGSVSWSLLRILRNDIAGQVTETVRRSILQNVPAYSSIAVFDQENNPRQLHVDVLPITSGKSPKRYYLLFLQTSGRTDGVPSVHPVAAPILSTDEREQLIARQEEELASTRIHLQSLVEEHDTRNQELVSANAEIQAANEELQSANEELGTTKEELQSANEELQTVNDELQQRNLVLLQTGNDLSNLLTSVNIPLLMLSSDLRIRQFTPSMQRLIRVRQTDIGRSIMDIRLHLSIDNLEDLLQKVLETLESREIEVTDHEGRWYALRIRPYRTSDHKIEGLVLVLMDIDEIHNSQQRLREAGNFALSIAEFAPMPVLVLTGDLRIEYANAAFCQLSHMSSKDLDQRSFPDLINLLWGMSTMREGLATLLTSGPPEGLSFEHTSTTADHKVLCFRTRMLVDGDRRSVLVVIEDVTSRTLHESLLQRENLQLTRDVQTATDRLDRTQEELRSLTAHLFTVQEEERRRIARELHDDVSQRLAALALLLKTETRSDLEKAKSDLHTLNSHVRELSHQLHPSSLDDLGLSTALKALVLEFGKQEGMEASYISRNLPPLPMQPAITAIYRIAQEALRNVAKHAGKTHVKVILEARSQMLRLEVVDLGIGFDQEDDTGASLGGLGLISMKERAHMAHGTFFVKSALGYGTTVTVEVPFDAADQTHSDCG